MIKIPKPFRHAGIMPNYECSSACRHCLYACSPTYEKGKYMDEDTMEEVMALLVEGGCRSVHIGGGEPFLNTDGLKLLLKTAGKHRIVVDYVETNSSWVASSANVLNTLVDILKAGADTFCISIDPFHAEFVPYLKPLHLAKTCEELGIGYFFWHERFISMLKDAEPNIPNDRQTLEKIIGKDYVYDIAKSYGIRMGGRAIGIELEYSLKFPVEELLKNAEDRRCDGLISTNHFHVDMYNRFIPPNCTGYVIPMKEVVNGIPEGKYRAFEASFYGGCFALYRLGLENGFVPNPKGYATRCALCFFIRKFLSETGNFPELEPEYYRQALSLPESYDA